MAKPVEASKPNPTAPIGKTLKAYQRRSVLEIEGPKSAGTDPKSLIAEDGWFAS